MKRPIAMMAVLSTAAMITAATPSLFPAAPAANVFAADTGWVDENGTWRYLDSDGYYVTDTWKKKENDMYFLDEEGEIATEMMINDEYYVNEEGKRVANQWVSFENEDDVDSPDAPENYWYYFGRDGRSVKSKWHKIENKWYYFDSEGRMLTGKQRIDDSTYYLGEENDGARKTGWISLEEENDDPDESSFWYFFDNNGRMVENQVDRKIDGSYYTFEDGRMQTGWYKLPLQTQEAAEQTEAAEENGAEGGAELTQEADLTGSTQVAPREGTIHGYQYYGEDGKRASGWLEIEGAKGISEEGELHRFYFRSGKPVAAETGIQTFYIDSKKYAFNEKGELQTGKQIITLENGETANAYFGTDGSMKTGKQTIFNEDTGENETWYFHADGEQKGQGFHGIRDNVIYYYGLRQAASTDVRFAPVEFDGVSYLVNTSGTIQKAPSFSKSSVKPELGNGFKDITDENGSVWTVDVNGVIQK